MGKNSLIKSTAKKKGSAKKAEEKDKHKKKSAKDTKNVEPASEQLPPPEPTLKELIFKNFQWTYSGPVVKQPVAEKDSTPYAPPATTENPEEVHRIQGLLKKIFDMDAIRAAAQPPEAIHAEVIQTTPEPAGDETKQELPAEHFVPDTQMPAITEALADSAREQSQDSPPVTESPTPEPSAEKPAQGPETDKLTETVTQAHEPPAAEQPVQAPETDKLTETVAQARNTSADQPPPRVDYVPSGQSGSTGDPVQRSIKILIAGAIAVILLIIGASWLNAKRYYIVPQKNAVEIWRGRFSPLGRHHELTLPIRYQNSVKELYSQEEVYPLIFNYYLGQADALLRARDLPDYEKIKGRLAEAEPYATSSDMKAAIRTRLNNMNRMALLYKADVALSRGKSEDLKTALELLQEAEKLAVNPADAELIKHKRNEAAERFTALQAKAVDKQNQPAPAGGTATVQKSGSPKTEEAPSSK